MSHDIAQNPAKSWPASWVEEASNKSCPFHSWGFKALWMVEGGILFIYTPHFHPSPSIRQAGPAWDLGSYGFPLTHGGAMILGCVWVEEEGNRCPRSIWILGSWLQWAFFYSQVYADPSELAPRLHQHPSWVKGEGVKLPVPRLPPPPAPRDILGHDIYGWGPIGLGQRIGDGWDPFFYLGSACQNHSYF